MLGTLEHDQKSDWRSHVAPIVQANNATKNDTTGYPHAKKRDARLEVWS